MGLCYLDIGRVKSDSTKSVRCGAKVKQMRDPQEANIRAVGTHAWMRGKANHL